jgi:hypothetical protein
MWRRVLYYQITWRHFTGVWRHVFYSTTTWRHITDDMWRSVFYQIWCHITGYVTSCILTRLHDLTSYEAWRYVFYQTWRYITGLMISCVLRPTTLRHFTMNMWRRVFYHTWRHVWSHVFYARLHDVTSQKTCDLMYSTRHDVTSQDTWHHVFYARLHEALHRGHDVTSDRTVLFTVNVFLTSKLNFSSYFYVLGLNLLCFVMLIMFAMHSRKLILHVHVIHMNKIKLNLVVM